MRPAPLPLALALALLLAGPAVSAAAPAQLTLALPGDAEIRTVAYDCDGGAAMQVTYINAAPNFLAVIPVGDGTQIFAAVLSASGAKYAAGNFVWWTKGPDADWYDLTQGEDAAPAFSCHEHNETP
ncbi:MliC family protein [Devosia sp.]|uniref:MliC family protein n=1 Tax=Devosia sp. TaxID=1871048 RepID=UPI002EFA89B2